MPNSKLKGLRAEKGWSQKVMGEKLNLSEQGYRKKENGESDFTVPEVNMILKLFPGTKYEDIFLN